MVYVKSYRDLEVYKLAREVSREIYLLSKTFPVEEKYSLTDQIRRSSRSVGAQIACPVKYTYYELQKLAIRIMTFYVTVYYIVLNISQGWIEVASECN